MKVHRNCWGSYPTLTKRVKKKKMMFTRRIRRRRLQALNASIFDLIKRQKYRKIEPKLKRFYRRVILKPEYLSLLLHCCVESRNKIGMKYLLSNGWDVNAIDQMGQTPLMMAIDAQNRKIIKILLRAGADIDLLNNKNESALHMAFAQHSSDAILHLLFRKFQKKCLSSEEASKKLIEAGCQLYQAVISRDARIIECMIQQGCKVDSEHQKTGETALIIAVQTDNIDCVKVLLEYGANVNALDIRGSTSLNYLCCHVSSFYYNRKKLKILKALLNKLSSKSCTYFDGFSQLRCALVEGNEDVITTILQSKFILSVRDEVNKQTLLHHLAENFNPGVIEALKPYIKDYNVNALDRWGESPLLVAVRKGNMNMVQLLLKLGANPNYANYESGETAIFVALTYFMKNPPRERYAELLLQYNADPQVIHIDSRGQKSTVFDAAQEINDLERMYPTIAHVALLEKLGTEIKDVISTKIHSTLLFKQYFYKCRRILKKKIFNSITIFKLLTADNKTIANYSKDKKLVRTLTRISYKQTFRSSYTHYYNLTKNRFKKVIRNKMLKNAAARVISTLSGDRFDADNLVVHKIIDYLSDDDREKLCCFKKQLA